MEEIVMLICGESGGFAPEVLVRLLLFCVILESIGSIAYALLGVGRRL